MGTHINNRKFNMRKMCANYLDGHNLVLSKGCWHSSIPVSNSSKWSSFAGPPPICNVSIELSAADIFRLMFIFFPNSCVA